MGTLEVRPNLDLITCQALGRTVRYLELRFKLSPSGFDFRKFSLQGQSMLLCAFGYLGSGVEQLGVDRHDGSSALLCSDSPRLPRLSAGIELPRPTQRAARRHSM
jgi:hypothetical protein